mmetsp:Transcript_45739/g.115613  ORF Transcript_45739/g.115613 Transcript_45739/m.115613 type:complete len:352 (-) Transcript_45739:409-1464(-)
MNPLSSTEPDVWTAATHARRTRRCSMASLGWCVLQAACQPETPTHCAKSACSAPSASSYSWDSLSQAAKRLGLSARSFLMLFSKPATASQPTVLSIAPSSQSNGRQEAQCWKYRCWYMSSSTGPRPDTSGLYVRRRGGETSQPGSSSQSPSRYSNAWALKGASTSSGGEGNALTMRSMMSLVTLAGFLCRFPVLPWPRSSVPRHFHTSSHISRLAPSASSPSLAIAMAPANELPRCCWCTPAAVPAPGTSRPSQSPHCVLRCGKSTPNMANRHWKVAPRRDWMRSSLSAISASLSSSPSPSSSSSSSSSFTSLASVSLRFSAAPAASLCAIIASFSCACRCAVASFRRRMT